MERALTHSHLTGKSLGHVANFRDAPARRVELFSWSPTNWEVLVETHGRRARVVTARLQSSSWETAYALYLCELDRDTRRCGVITQLSAL